MEGNTHDRRVISAVLQLARVHLHRGFRPFHSTYAYSPLTLASWGWARSEYLHPGNQQMPCIRAFENTAFPESWFTPDSHCKHQCFHSFLEQLCQVSSDRGKSSVGPERVYFPEWFWICLLEIGLEFQPFIQLGNRFCVLKRCTHQGMWARDWRWAQVWIQTDDVVCRLMS